MYELINSVDLIKVIILNNLLFHYILIIVLIGILVSQKFERRKVNQKGIIPYVVLCSGIAIFMIINTFRFLGIKFSPPFSWFNPFLAIAIGSIILWNSYNVKNKINKTISFVVFLISFFIATFEIFKIFYDDLIYWFLESLFTFIGTFLLYYIVIDFLIKTSENKK